MVGVRVFKEFGPAKRALYEPLFTIIALTFRGPRRCEVRRDLRSYLSAHVGE